MLNPLYRIIIQQSHVPAGQTPIIVEAPIPAEFSFDSNASYATSLPQGPNSGILSLVTSAFGTRLSSPVLTAQLWQGSSDTQLSLNLEFHTENDPVTDVQTPILNLNRLVMPSISSSTGLMQSPGPALNFTAENVGNVAKDAGSGVFQTGGDILGQIFGNNKPQQGSLNNTSTTTNDGANSAAPPSARKNPQLGTTQYWKSRVNNQISIRIGNYLYFDSVVITNVQQTFASNFDPITGLPHYAAVSLTFKPFFMLTQEDLNQVFTSKGSSQGGSQGSTSNNLGSSIPSF